MKKPFNYELNIIMAARHIAESVKASYPDAEIIRDFFDFYNDTCPRCQTRLKVSNNTVQKVGTVSCFVQPENKKAYVYATCKECAKEIAKTSKFGTKTIHGSDGAENTEKFVVKTLADK